MLLRYRRIRRASFICCGLGFARYLLVIEIVYAISLLVLSIIYIRDPIIRW